MASKRKTADDRLEGIQAFIIALFPDAAERERLFSAALSKMSAKKLSKDIPIADVVIEMLRIQRSRRLLQLVLAMQPRRTTDLRSLFGGADAGSLEEVAYLAGVSDGTAERWLSEGLPNK